MKHLFVPYELAKQLKEKGYDEICLAIYQRGDNLYAALTPEREIGKTGFGTAYNSLMNNGITAPLYQQVVDWIREKGIVISVYNNASGYLWNMAKTACGTNIADSDYDGTNDSGCWDEYYGALEHAIEQALKRI